MMWGVVTLSDFGAALIGGEVAEQLKARQRREYEALVAHVSGTHGLGRRAARRFVERNLDAETLANWRAHDVFPARDVEFNADGRARSATDRRVRK